MKKYILLFLSLIILGITTPTFGQKKVAVTTFWVDKHIGFDKLDEGQKLIVPKVFIS